MKEFRVQIRIKNNLLQQRREELGLTQHEIAKQIPMSYHLYNALECMREKPFNKKSKWREVAIRLAAFFGLLPEDIWPGEVCAVEKTKAERCVDSETMRALVGNCSYNSSQNPERLLMAKERKEAVNEALETLTEREQEIIRRRCEESQSYRETGRGMNYYGNAKDISGSRVMQIEAKAIRKLRHPSRSNKLREVL